MPGPLVRDYVMFAYPVIPWLALCSWGAGEQEDGGGTLEVRLVP